MLQKYSPVKPHVPELPLPGQKLPGCHSSLDFNDPRHFRLHFSLLPWCGDLLGQLSREAIFLPVLMSQLPGKLLDERGSCEISWVGPGWEDGCRRPWELFWHPCNLLCLSQSLWRTSTVVPTITWASWGLPSLRAKAHGALHPEAHQQWASANRSPALQGSCLAFLMALVFLVQIFS